MQVWLDGAALEMPAAETVEELLAGLGPMVDPGRLVTRVEVDGAAIDATDALAIGRRRLGGAETVQVSTETPAEFAAARRREMPAHLTRLAEIFTLVAHGLGAGQERDASRVLAEGARELGLVLELDQRLSTLDATEGSCVPVVAAVRRVGSQLTEAQRDRRWSEVARLLAEDLIPALRAGATSA
jgi:hypothetical protein